jgi:hypothetical protein
MPCISERGGQPGGLETPGSWLRAFVLLGEAYPAHHAPGVEVARELTLVAVARHQHHEAHKNTVGIGPGLYSILQANFGE